MATDKHRFAQKVHEKDLKKADPSKDQYSLIMRLQKEFPEEWEALDEVFACCNHIPVAGTNTQIPTLSQIISMDKYVTKMLHGEEENPAAAYFIHESIQNRKCLNEKKGIKEDPYQTSECGALSFHYGSIISKL
ncbi:hypothetical protein GOV11_00105 [Candidatus Woesearchaeota archaeon]|nr:hypothetical protein [Candidatus Woesearchaeota archaeon]